MAVLNTYSDEPIETTIDFSNNNDGDFLSWNPLSGTGLSPYVGVEFFMPISNYVDNLGRDNYYIKFSEKFNSGGKYLPINQFIYNPTIYGYVSGSINLETSIYSDKMDIRLDFAKTGMRNIKLINTPFGDVRYQSNNQFDILGYGLSSPYIPQSQLTLLNKSNLGSIDCVFITGYLLLIVESNNGIVKSYAAGSATYRKINRRHKEDIYLGGVENLLVVEPDLYINEDDGMVPTNENSILPERIGYSEVNYDNNVEISVDPVQKYLEENKPTYKPYKINTEHKLF